MAFDPALVKDQLPEGIRFRTLREYAAHSSSVVGYLRKYPGRSDWARGYVEIMRSDNYLVDGRHARFGVRGGMAVWYAYVERAQTSDERPRGDNVLALGSWISDSTLARYMRRKGFPVRTAEIEFWRDSKSIDGRMKEQGLEISGTCQPQGEPEKLELPTPAYVTVWTPRTVARTFEMLTGYGIRKQVCSAVGWKAEGGDLLVAAFFSRPMDVEETGVAVYEFGYMLRTALNRHK